MTQPQELHDIEQAVEQLRLAMIAANRTALQNLADDNLTYGHSNGNVETKAQFVENIASGKSNFVNIELTEQSIVIAPPTAIVRHLFNAVTNDGGIPGAVKLKVLLVWQKQAGAYKLLARQAVRVV